MRYIGSKLSLLPQLDAVISDRKTNGGVFCDIFSGTGAVGRYFKNRYPIISNDILFFSHVLQFAGISLNSTPDLSKLEKTIGDPFVFLNEINPLKYKFATTPFIATEYSPYQNGERLYFQEKTALHIDAIRQTLDKWLTDSMIDESGFKYLLASLIEKVPSVSNIAGTYGAYLKHWDTRTFKPLVLEPVLLIDNKKKNYSFNKDGNELIKEIEGEILYVDPPYNGRQYLGNYHLLETIAKYDAAKLKGKTGIREDITKLSDYCKKGKVTQAFNDLLSNSKFDYVFVSYSTEGLLTEDELVSIVEQNSKPSKIRVFKFPYRRYSRIKDDNKPQVYEIVVSAVR